MRPLNTTLRKRILMYSSLYILARFSFLHPTYQVPRPKLPHPHFTVRPSCDDVPLVVAQLQCRHSAAVRVVNLPQRMPFFTIVSSDLGK